MVYSYWQLYTMLILHSYYIYKLSPLFFLSDANLSSQYILYIETWESGLDATIYQYSFVISKVLVDMSHVKGVKQI